MDPKLANALMGALHSATVKRPGAPAIHAVKTEGPLGGMLRGMIPGADGEHHDLGSILDGAIADKDGGECECGECCCCILKELSGKKYQLILAYIHYGDQLRAMYRDGIYEHFKEHMKEERAQLYEINKKITALGSDAPCQPGHVPSVALNDARAIFHALLQIEMESIRLWSALFRKTQDDVALNGMAQAYATECQGHADDLKRYLRSCE